MPTISISTETLQSLKQLAEPLVDTPDSVINRLIEQARGALKPAAPRKDVNAIPADRVRPTLGSTNGTRARRGEATPRRVYQQTLIEVLQAAGGELEARAAIEGVGSELRSRFRPIDLARLPTGEDRWINAVRFARKDLIDDGTLDREAPHGTWRLTAKARGRLGA